MPAEVTDLVVVKLPPPQLYVAPGVVELAVSVILVVAQVNVPVAGFTLAFGAVVLLPMVELAVAVQPFDVLVTVTVYVPAEVTDFVAVRFPPPQS